MNKFYLDIGALHKSDIYLYSCYVVRNCSYITGATYSP